jgi:molybdenum cofactor cytidylyltransferase
MIFDDFPLAAAEGVILAHSLRLSDAGINGAWFKKGRVLSADDVATLAAAGLKSVVGGRLEPGDLDENAAANAVAAALIGDNVGRSTAFTGRSNLSAMTGGLLLVDHDRVRDFNRVNEAVTVATAAPWSIVAPQQMVATIKIIPFGVERRVVEACTDVLAAGPRAITVKPFVPHRVALILTTLASTKESVLDGTVAANRGRVEALGSQVVLELRCRHHADALEPAIRQALAAGCTLVMISGASATVDRRDVVPAAIVRAGGTIEHFGLPVDPGNLLLLSRIGGVPVLDLPGCARSAKFNGLDLVLRRVLAGVAVTSRDIMDMGVGGLLKEIPTRPLPRARALPPEQAEAPAPVPRFAVVVLAAGGPGRAERNPLTLEAGGKPLVAHVVDAALAAKVGPVSVVTGHDEEKVRAALGERPVSWVHNPAYGEGLASSLRAGLAALPAGIDGALICLGDMPTVTAAHIASIVAAFDPDEGRAICVPEYRGKRGNPILWGRQFFAEMQALSGDRGARLIDEHAEQVCFVPVADSAVLADIDALDTLAALVNRQP